ncbi:NADH-quinone oxidoreductase subunit N [Megalodesulfovibrio gigas]|uniref:NADH-quinone oxidoreductase subunit N n=1 Tax=Megalodesulfovibrio gigas (strain ATCC 19364 / DSM 1382 / NCIMB 9332 / VKM B-1759) TaxID=1121448 RepID=T2G6I4_MEGG1|nr:NADH-quinone oxidoreductase subunit N [Megalodesulfovibrio gigas]AGW12185.1 putative NADH dehydrogenase (quinone) [Megalodesulfovibrio gigas DSM 1382 = ATCC 19364]
MSQYNLALCLPELALFGVMAVLFVQSLTPDGSKRCLCWLPYGGLATIAAALIGMGDSGSLFYGAYQIDALSQFFKLAVAVGFTIAALNAANPPQLDAAKKPDFYFFLAASAWGLMLLASCVECVTIYVALEISSYSLYAVVPLRAKERQAAEAGVKYILFGAVATAIALYGLSYLWGSHGTTYLAVLAGKDFSLAGAPLAAVGLAMFLCGMFYKLALFPFHFWAPDVYQGSANETSAFIATLPKLGAAVVLVRFAALLTPGLEVTLLLAVLGAISMTYGNLAALAQRDIKRLLGYSSVAHAGYLMLGLVSGTAEGLAAASFYALVYILMNLAIFWVLCRLAPDGKNVALEDLDGLSRREPVLALVLAVSAFALVGLPPTAGFMGKLMLLKSAWGHGYNWLVIVAVLNTAIAIYYYLSLVRHAYTHDADDVPAGSVKRPMGDLVWGLALAVVLLVMGTMPGAIFDLATAAGHAVMP